MPLAPIDAVLRVLWTTMSNLVAHSAILMGEEVNRRLEALLRAFLLDDHKNLNEIFSERGPLGSFYSRIEMAAALGLISSTERQDLNLIRRIRNHMAHHPLFRCGQNELAFEDEKIKSRCARLKIPSEFDDELLEPWLLGDTKFTEAASKFFKACAILAATFIARTSNIARCQTAGPPTEAEIRTGIRQLHAETSDPELADLDKLVREIRQILAKKDTAE